jgi:undecaprenyl diphosphate synthase
VGLVIYRAYEWGLLQGITTLPGHICFMITEEDLLSAPAKMTEVSRWCTEINASSVHRIASREAGESLTTRTIRVVTFHISTEDPGKVARNLGSIRNISTFARLVLHVGETSVTEGRGIEVVGAVGKSGRDEIVSCIRKMASDHLLPEEVDEQTFERYLTFPYTPDLVIKTGGYHLTDFLIWQSVYSELFFSDVNWKWFRKIDFLRILRDYQARKRRFGK